MSLSRKQTAKVAAALCLIKDMGHDLAAVSREVGARLRNGTPAQRAYQDSLNSFAGRHPSMLRPLQQATKLIEASSIATVARYNVALRQYIETGDDSALNGLVPLIAQDMVDLADHTGETAPEFSAELDSAISGEAPPQDAAPAGTAPIPATFAFAQPE